MSSQICRRIFSSFPLDSLKNVYFLPHRNSSICRHQYLTPQRRIFSSAAILQAKTASKKAKEDRRDVAAAVARKNKAKADARVIKVWRNMTVMDLALAMDKDLDHVYEAMIFVDNSADYDQPWKTIDNIKVIQDIVKRCGMRCAIGGAPTPAAAPKEFKDAVRRPAGGVQVPRHPVVTIMGHVDHGKTTLLDSLRHTRVVDGEFGGITQHIGAFQVKLEGQVITFLDTPGHAAFTAMRSRGAHVTDLVVLVVAADDGVMEQTTESIRLANEAKVPILVAINKVDKPQADIERTKKMLLSQGLVLEESGGDVMCVPVSALKGTGLPQLVEAIHTQASLLDLKAEAKGPVEAVVVESRTDPYRGKLSTAIIQRGKLKRGAVLVSGTAWAKVRGMFDDEGKPVQEAGPSEPVEIIGWKELPSAGDEILEVESERRAHDVVEYRKSLKQKEKSEEDSVVIQKKVEDHLKEYKVALELKRSSGKTRYYRVRDVIKESNLNAGENTGPKLSIIVKGDVDGSVEALLDVLDSYTSSQCKLDVIHYGVGPVTEGDVKLAEPFGAIIYAFNVGTTGPNVKKLLSESAASGVRLKENNVIYRIFEDMRAEMEKLLPAVDAEDVIGEANVLQEFVVTEGKKKLPVAGCRCVKGVLKKDGLFRLIRGEEVVFDGKLSSMKHLKNEVDSIKKDVECGLRLEDAEIRFQSGDTLLCYQLKKVPQKIDWDTGF